MTLKVHIVLSPPHMETAASCSLPTDAQPKHSKPIRKTPKRVKSTEMKTTDNGFIVSANDVR
jgi:hypothetical protein